MFSFAIATDEHRVIASELLECGKFLAKSDEVSKKLKSISCDWIGQLRLGSRKFQTLGETLKWLTKTRQIKSRQEFPQSAEKGKVVITIAESQASKGIKIWETFTSIVHFYCNILSPHVETSWRRSLPVFNLFLPHEDASTKIATIAEVSFVRRDSEQSLVQAKAKLIDDLFNFQNDIAFNLRKFKPNKNLRFHHFERSMFARSFLTSSEFELQIINARAQKCI